MASLSTTSYKSVEKTSCCPYCKGKLYKHGKTGEEKQRYRCRECRKTHIEHYSYKGYNPNLNQDIIALTKDGVGIRTARLLGISPTTLIARIKKIASEIKEHQTGLKKYLIFIAFLSFCGLNAQHEVDYYVGSKTLNLRSQPTSKSEVITTLSQHSNLKVNETLNNWSKVQFGDLNGYVFNKFIKKGKAIVSSYEVRIGAKCRDGSNSNTTGRGACSHHGGVSYWRTRTIKEVEIVKSDNIKNQ
ncbi:SH3 domain-containing protein [Flavobacteriaceae bacterium]|nr:SH3 domain-containing protein [Flavobacteriaceae bacterium]